MTRKYLSKYARNRILQLANDGWMPEEIAAKVNLPVEKVIKALVRMGRVGNKKAVKSD